MTSYALLRTPEEYERLRDQARVWETATARLLDRIGLAAGARCLDAGCGPGETMRLLAHRVGPSGSVTGLDSDASLVATTAAMLAADGHRTCRVLEHDVTRDEPLQGGPYDLVFARLLLFHLPRRTDVLARLWAAVAPGGHLVVQDYDLISARCVPDLASVSAVAGLVIDAFEAAGCDVQAGPRLPTLLADAGAGTPEGTDVAGLLLPLSKGQPMLAQVLRSLLPVALRHGLTTTDEAEVALAAFADDARVDPDHPMLWPLMMGIWKARP